MLLLFDGHLDGQQRIVLFMSKQRRITALLHFVEENDLCAFDLAHTARTVRVFLEASPCKRSDHNWQCMHFQ